MKGHDPFGPRKDAGLDGVGHGYWMPKLWVVEARICRGSGGFGVRFRQEVDHIKDVMRYK